jgi:serine protease AprX
MFKYFLINNSKKIFTMIKIKIFFLFFCLFFINSKAQTEDAWVYFIDKPNATQYLQNPLSMLSQRALDRRANQNIALDIYDVPLHQPYIDAITTQAGITIMAKSKWFNCLHIRGTQANINALENLSYIAQVVFANKTFNRMAQNFDIKEKLNKKTETQINFNYGNAFNQISLHNGQFLHQNNFTGTGKIIAVIDDGFTGVNTAQPFQRLFSNNLILGGYNFVENNNNVYTNGSHGTNVLSCIGGFKNNELVGTAPDAQYYLFVTEAGAYENPVEESFWVAAAEQADYLGVDVINTSLGYSTFDNASYNYTYQDMNGNTAFISKGLNRAVTRGMICVNSAGNAGNSSWQHIIAPADAQNALTVGAINSNGNYVNFSSRGPTSDNRIKPDVVAKGLNASVSSSSGTIGTSSGTSFSSPIMAGLVTCLWQAFPQMTNFEIMSLVKQSSSLYQNPNNNMGFGIPNFQLAYNLGSNNYNVSEESVIYPNPFLDILNVKLKTENIKDATFLIFNSLGQIISSHVLNNSYNYIRPNINSSGVYYYELIMKNETTRGKLIKN